MRGDERERYCSKCSHTVVNISLLTMAEREALLANPPAGGLCVSYYRRLSGEDVSAEKPLTATESRRVVQWGVIAASAATIATAAHFAPEISASAGPGIGPAGSAIAQTCEDLKERGKEVLYDLGLMQRPPPAAYLIMGVMVCPPAVSTPGSTVPSPTSDTQSGDETASTSVPAPVPPMENSTI